MQISKIILSILFCIHFGVLSSQSFWSNRYDLALGNDFGEQVIVQKDGIIVKVIGLCDGNSRFCVGLFKLDFQGNVLWKNVIYDTLDTNYPESISIRNDTILMNLNYANVEGKDYTVLMYDSEGNELGRNDYFHESINGFKVARGITTSKNLVFVQFSYDSASGKGRETIRAFSSTWEEKWEQSFPNTFENPQWADIEASQDGGVVVIYSSWENGTGDRIGTIEKYSKSGDMEWQTTLPHIGDSQSGWVKIDPYPDGGYIGFWQFDTSAFFITEIPSLVFKLDSLGNIEWERLELNEQYFFYDIFSARNGDIIGCGIAEDWPWENDPEYEAAYVSRMNSKGERIWDRKIFEKTDGAVKQLLYGGAELPNGDLVFTGRIDDTIFGTPDDYAPTNTWVIKLDSMGCLNADCDDWQYITSSTSPPFDVTDAGFIIYPNPARERVYIGMQFGNTLGHGDYRVKLYDLSGRLLHNDVFDPELVNSLDLGSLPPGAYSITIWKDNHLIQSEKLILE